jgi:type IV pilus assembly protein PilW
MNIFRAKSKKGFTLIELMIALLIGGFILAGILQVFVSAKQAYRLQENLSRLQENGRFALDFITKDLRIAGYTGCSKLGTLKVVPPAFAVTGVNVTNATDGTANVNGISGVNNVTSTNWNAATCGSACLLNTDVISFQSAKSCGGELTANMLNGTDTVIDASNACSIKTNDVLLIGNCSQTDIFKATNSPAYASPLPARGTATQTITHAALNANYGTDAELFQFQSASYFIRLGAGGMPSLWRVDNIKWNTTKSIYEPAATEMVEGIEDLQVLYGIDSDPIPDYVANYYVTANNVDSAPDVASIPPVDPWTRLVSIRVSILAATIDNNLTDKPQSYFYNGATTTPPDVCASNDAITQLPCVAPAIQVQDLRIRRVFSSTFAVRNRLP